MDDSDIKSKVKDIGDYAEEIAEALRTAQSERDEAVEKVKHLEAQVADLENQVETLEGEQETLQENFNRVQAALTPEQKCALVLIGTEE